MNGYTSNGNIILSPVRVLFPVGASILTADRVLHSTGE